MSTLIFPDSYSSESAPLTNNVPIPENVTAINVPSTSNVLSPISHDTSLAFYTSYSEVADFLRAAQEIPAQEIDSSNSENKTWIMKAARIGANGARGVYQTWLRDGWTSFVDLVKVGLT